MGHDVLAPEQRRRLGGVQALLPAFEQIAHGHHLQVTPLHGLSRTEQLDGAGDAQVGAAEDLHGAGTGIDGDGHARRDPALEHPRSVYQHLVRHFARYTPEMVERVAGVPRERFLELADRYTACSGPDQTATICYAVGLTQHSVGVQVIRTAAILQLLLGNVGRPGGGILALRGHSSIQGSTDIPTLYDLLPGYLPMPAFGSWLAKQ